MTAQPPSNDPWNQPGPTYANQPQHPYPQNLSPYGTPPAGFGVQPVPYPAYAAPYGAPNIHPVIRPATTGIVGLALVLLGTIVMGVFMVLGLQHLLEFITWTEEQGMYEGSVAYQEEMDRYIGDHMGEWLLCGLGALVGLAGWIVSIVAMVRNAGRGYGVAGLVIGIVAPIIVPVAAFVLAAAELVGLE